MFEGLNWGGFLLAMLVVELTPGPNMGWLTALSAQSGRVAGFRAVAGITLGLTVQMLAAATGLSTLIAGHDLVYEVIRWSGVAFMIYLAFGAWRESGVGSAGRIASSDGFGRGLIANLLNPKALVFYIAVVGQFADPERGSFVSQILILGTCHLILALIVHTAIVLLGSSLGQSLRKWQSSWQVRGGFAVSLLGIALWIAVSTQR